MPELLSAPTGKNTGNTSKTTGDNLNSDQRTHSIGQRLGTMTTTGEVHYDEQAVERDENMRESEHGAQSTVATEDTPKLALSACRYENFDDVNNHGNGNQNWVGKALEKLETAGRASG